MRGQGIRNRLPPELFRRWFFLSLLVLGDIWSFVRWVPDMPTNRIEPTPGCGRFQFLQTEDLIVEGSNGRSERRISRGV